MNIVTTRFGLIQAAEADIVRIPEGLVGFRSFTQFVHLPGPGGLRPVVAAKHDGAGTGLRAGGRRHRQSATTGSSFDPATARPWSWTRSATRSST